MADPERTMRLERELRKLRCDLKYLDGIDPEYDRGVKARIEEIKTELYGSRPQADPIWLSAYNL